MTGSVWFAITSTTHSGTLVTGVRMSPENRMTHWPRANNQKEILWENSPSTDTLLSNKRHTIKETTTTALVMRELGNTRS